MQDDFEVKEQSVNEPLIDECLIVRKIFGQCRQQDCLKPVDCCCPIDPRDKGIRIGSSILCQSDALYNSNVLYGESVSEGETIQINQGYSFILKKETFKVKSITVPTVEESSFCSAGYWDVTIRYTFSYILNVIDATGATVSFNVGSPTGLTTTDICACESYDKKISLFGGDTSCNDVVYVDTLYDSGNTLFNDKVPKVQVQAIAKALKVNNGVYEIPTEPGVVVYQANVVIGLFTVIRLYRMVSLIVPSPGYCDVPLCEANHIGEPCEFFNNLPFPFDDFNPEQREIHRPLK